MSAARRLIAALLAAALVGGAALAEAPAASPRPEPRPVPEGQPAVLAAVSTSAAVALPIGLLRPRARPAVAAVSPSAPAESLRPAARPWDGPEELVQAAAVITQPAPPATVGRKGELCGDPALVGVKLSPIAGKMQGCGLKDGVRLTEIDGVELSAPITVDCATALSLRAWLSGGAKEAVGKRGDGLWKILVAGSYSCRTRNNQRGARISEHGRGRAVDMSGFVLKDGEVLLVRQHWGKGKQGEILKALHGSACGAFGTVLGPGSDRYHRDHFHVDTNLSRNGSYCR
jgi:hypothetical protein